MESLMNAPKSPSLSFREDPLTIILMTFVVHPQPPGILTDVEDPHSAGRRFRCATWPIMKLNFLPVA
ncbi:unnamed protein product, partial [Nesidiocoris tenuis]